MTCKWCGNTSGLKDSRGACVSCGGFSEEINFSEIKTRDSIEIGMNTAIGYSALRNASSGCEHIAIGYYTFEYE